MRLWSLHPSYLDAKGLVALWREALLAQKVLLGQTKGYRNHPQLRRFRDCPTPIAAMCYYLTSIADEADRRNYQFNRQKIASDNDSVLIAVTHGQIQYEWQHLTNKLKQRDPQWYEQWSKLKRIRLHPLFYEIDGGVEHWEKIVTVKSAATNHTSHSKNQTAL